MAKGKHNSRRGGSRGSSRGGGRGRGRGNGQGRERGGGYDMDDFDFPVQMWPANQPPNSGSTPNRGFSTPKPRGRGRGGYFNSDSGYTTPRRDYDNPRGRGRGDGTPSQVSYGRGRGLGSKLRGGAPLSKLLYEDRPLLRPIKFVRSVHTATLFQEEEELLQPIQEAVADDEASHIPTAEQVASVFNGTPPEEADSESSSEEEQLQEIDFAEIGKMQAAVDAAAAASKTAVSEEVITVEKLLAGIFVDTTPAPVHARSTSNGIAVERVESVLGDVGDDDDIIVYVAPHPRKAPSIEQRRPEPVMQPLPSMSVGTRMAPTVPPPADAVPAASWLEINREAYRSSSATPSNNVSVTAAHPAEETPPSAPVPLIVTPPTFESVSFSFAQSKKKWQMRRLHPAGTPRALLKRKPRRKSLRAMGALLSEAQLRGEDPRKSERRHDSDVNWGTSDEDAVDELSNGVGGMALDEDVSVDAMRGFVKSMSADGSRHVTMDDIADAEEMRKEDEENKRGSESEEEQEESSESEDEEVEEILREQEQALVAEADDSASLQDGEGDDGGDEDEDEDEDDDDSDEEETPRRSFQARLTRLRASTKGKGKALEQEDDSSDEAMSVQMTWADQDEDVIADIEDMFIENPDILKDKMARNKLFRAVQDGDFDTDELSVMSQPAKRRKDKNIPPELQEQWEKDRQKKAENKRARALARLVLAANPFAQHKGGKKGQKAMLAAARLDADIEISNRVVDLVSLEQQIRRFLTDIGGKREMVLPPADKETRKRVHELAAAFNLKSQSRGNGASRYTTLIKTSRSGIQINEKKVLRLMRTADRTWTAPGTERSGSRANLAKHREGEEVGKAAPKIGESNIGFKMLAAMGWSEGERIGLSGGLDAPLTAIMKMSKLGLGATLRS